MIISVNRMVSESVGRGLGSFLPVLSNIVLYVLTVWIPYLNIGTTIGLTAGIPLKMRKGETVGYTEIFDPVYRKRMGPFFLTLGMIYAGGLVATALFVGPGIVLGLAWFLAPLLVIDRGLEPGAALSRSHELTMGEKGVLFLSGLLLDAVFLILAYGCYLVYENSPVGGSALGAVLAVFAVPITLGWMATAYEILVDEGEAEGDAARELPQ